MAGRNPNGLGTYYTRSVKGRIRYCWDKRYNGKTIKLSATTQVKLKAKIKAWEKSLVNTGAKENIVTLAEFIDDYLERRKPSLKQKTFDSYNAISKLFLKTPPLGKKLITSITTTMIQDYINTLSKTYSPVYVSDIRRCLNLILNGAIAEGYLHINPCSLTKPPRQRTKEVVVLTPEQINCLLTEAKKGDYFFDKTIVDNDGLLMLRHQFYMVLLLTVYTGIRRGECFGLSWDNVFLDEERIRIAQALTEGSQGLKLDDPKTEGSKRNIMIPNFVTEALANWKEEQKEFALNYAGVYDNKDNLVFTNTNGGAWNLNNVNKRYWHRLRKACNLPEGFKWHWLRHTHASWLIKQGVPITEVTRRLGHSSSVVTLKVYSHAYRNDESKAIVELEKISEDMNNV